MRDSQSEYDVTVKCIVQCSQLFGEGVSELRVCDCNNAKVKPAGGPDLVLSLMGFYRGGMIWPSALFIFSMVFVRNGMVRYGTVWHVLLSFPTKTPIYACPGFVAVFAAVKLSQSLFCSPRIDESSQELSWSYYMGLGPVFIHNLFLCMKCHLPIFLWLSCPRATFFLGVQLFSTFFKVWS